MPMQFAEDLTGRTWDARVVTGYSGSDGKGPKWRVECRACGLVRNLRRAYVLAELGCGTCARRARGNIRTDASRSHAATLTQHKWPHTCPTCGRSFLGTARQVYHSPECRPNYELTRRPRKDV